MKSAKFSEIFSGLKEYLKSQLTAENTEIITHIDKSLDDLNEEHKSTETEMSDLKDKFLEMVKTTGFKSDIPPASTPEDKGTQPLGIDEAMIEALNELKKE